MCLVFVLYYVFVVLYAVLSGSMYILLKKRENSELFVLHLVGRSAWRCPRCTWNPADPKQQVLYCVRYSGITDTWRTICLPDMYTWMTCIVYLGRVGGGENGTGDEDEDDHPHLHSPDLRSCTISRIRIRNQDHGPGSTFHSHLPSWYLI